MNPGTVSGLCTLVLLVLFLGGWRWVWSEKRRDEFEAAARLPLEDEDKETHQ